MDTRSTPSTLEPACLPIFTLPEQIRLLLVDALVAANWEGIAGLSLFSKKVKYLFHQPLANKLLQLLVDCSYLHPALLESLAQANLFIRTRPDLIFADAIAKTKNGEKISATPLAYVVAIHDLYWEKQFFAIAKASSQLNEFIRQVTAQKTRATTVNLTTLLAEYQTLIYEEYGDLIDNIRRDPAMNYDPINHLSVFTKSRIAATQLTFFRWLIDGIFNHFKLAAPPTAYAAHDAYNNELVDVLEFNERDPNQFVSLGAYGKDFALEQTKERGVYTVRFDADFATAYSNSQAWCGMFAEVSKQEDALLAQAEAKQKMA